MTRPHFFTCSIEIKTSNIGIRLMDDTMSCHIPIKQVSKPISHTI
jgi:hypothetical protein